MSTLTIRLPDDTHDRVKEIARRRGMSVNKLMEELSTIAIVRHDAEKQFRVLVARGSVEAGLRVLDGLDASLGDAAALRSDSRSFLASGDREPPAARIRAVVSARLRTSSGAGTTRCASR